MSETKKWIGKRFYDWCGDDIEDERKIYYTMHSKEGVSRFTSEDKMGYEWLWRLRKSIIMSLELGNDNAWHIELKY